MPYFLPEYDEACDSRLRRGTVARLARNRQPAENTGDLNRLLYFLPPPATNIKDPGMKLALKKHAGNNSHPVEAVGVELVERFLHVGVVPLHHVALPLEHLLRPPKADNEL